MHWLKTSGGVSAIAVGAWAAIGIALNSGLMGGVIGGALAHMLDPLKLLLFFVVASFARNWGAAAIAALAIGGLMMLAAATGTEAVTRAAPLDAFLRGALATLAVIALVDNIRRIAARLTAGPRTEQS